MASTDTDDILDQQIERAGRALPGSNTQLPTEGLVGGRPADTASGAFPGNELAGVTKGGTDPIVFDPRATQEFRQGSQFAPGVDPYSIYREQQGRTEQLRGQLETNIGQRQQLATQIGNLPHPAQPRLQNVPQAPQPTPRSFFGELAPTLMLFATLGSGFVKGHAVQALSAATGLINGWDKGDAEMRQAAIDNWQNKAKQLHDQNKVELDRYQAVLDDRNLSVKDKQAQIGVLAAEFDDRIRLHQVESGDMRSLFSLQNAQTRGNAQLQAAQIRAAGGALTPLTDDALRSMARRTLQGEPISSLGLGRRPENLNRFQNILEEERNKAGMSPEQMSVKQAEFQGYKTEQRLLATRKVNLGMAAQSFLTLTGPALAINEKVPRGKWVPINQINQNLKKYASDPDLREFSNRNAALITEFAAVIQRGSNVTTVHAQQRAAELLNTAESPEAYRRAVETLIDEVDRVEKVPYQIEDEYRRRFLEGGEAPSRAPAPAAPSGGTGGWR